MKSVRIFLSTVLFVFTPLIFSQENLEPNDQMKITQILKKTKEYCERLNQVALYFVCKEEISEKYNVQRFNPTNKLAKMMIGQKHELLYDYQLIRKGKQKEEKRILLEENGIRKKKRLKALILRCFNIEMLCSVRIIFWLKTGSPILIINWLDQSFSMEKKL